ncbi:MAG: hypothetical protein AAF541_23300 [Pseudomonadota bacterium]
MFTHIDDIAWEVLDEANGLQRLTASYYRVKELSLNQVITELESQPERYTQRFLEILSAGQAEDDAA